MTENTSDHGKARFTELSKGFDGIHRQLLITKLNAYVVDANSL